MFQKLRLAPLKKTGKPEVSYEEVSNILNKMVGIQEQFTFVLKKILNKKDQNAQVSRVYTERIPEVESSLNHDDHQNNFQERESAQRDNPQATQYLKAIASFMPLIYDEICQQKKVQQSLLQEQKKLSIKISELTTSTKTSSPEKQPRNGSANLEQFPDIVSIDKKNSTAKDWGELDFKQKELFQGMIDQSKVHNLKKQSKQKQIENQKFYSRISQIQPFSDKRQIKVKIDFHHLFEQKGSQNVTKIIDENVLKNKLTEWLGIVYRAVASICWNQYKSEMLSFEQCKILFTQNIIFNYVELLKELKEIELGISLRQITQLLNKKAIEILDYLGKQYPQTETVLPNLLIKAVIPKIDQKGKLEYELIAKSKLRFYPKKSKDYSTQILKMCNFLIEQSNTCYSQFEKFLQSIFDQNFIPSELRGSKDIVQSQQLMNYKQKVKKYTKILTNQKIPKNIPKYSQRQIREGIFFSKQPAILRLLTKWAEQLLEVVDNPDKMIRQWYHNFKDHDGNQMDLEYYLKEGISNKIKQQREHLYDRVRQIRQECDLLQAKLTDNKFTSANEYPHLNEEQIRVGLFSSNMRNALSNYIVRLLNQVIHFLLEIPFKVDEFTLNAKLFYFKREARKQLDKVNLITFRNLDLIRCKYVSNEAEVVWVMKELVQHHKNNPSFKLIRVKDRLEQGTRDVLVNSIIDNGLPNQIQLSITSEMTERSNLLDKYNHFLYQLKRALLGPMIEAVSIWTTFEQRADFYSKISQKTISKRQVYKIESHDCSDELMKITISPIICDNCDIFFYMQKNLYLNYKCLGCSKTFCGQCYLLSINQERRKNKFFGNQFGTTFLKEIKEYSNYQLPFPKNGFILKKSCLKRELFFYSTFEFKEREAAIGYVIKGFEQKNIERQILLTAVCCQLNNGQISSQSFFNIKVNKREQKYYPELNKQTSSILNKYVIYYFDTVKTQETTVDQIVSQFKTTTKQWNVINCLYEPNYIDRLHLYTKRKTKKQLLKDIKQSIGTTPMITARYSEVMVLLSIASNQQLIQNDVIQKKNIKTLRSYALSSKSVIQMEKKMVKRQFEKLPQALGKQLYESMTKNLKRLFLRCCHIQSIAGLKDFLLLEMLHLGQNQVTSLSGIQQMRELTFLNIQDNKITSLKSLVKCTKLENINCAFNQIVTFEGIKDLVKLKYFTVAHNKFKKFEYFQKLGSLELLHLKTNQIEEYNNLENLVNLKILILGDNPWKRLEGYSKLPNLTYLSFCDQLERMTSIPHEITTTSALHTLIMAQNNIMQIPDLSKLVNLKLLSLRNNLIKKIEGVSELSLERLEINNNQIKVIENLGKLEFSLNIILISGNPIEDCSYFQTIDVNFIIEYTKEQMAPNAIKQLQDVLGKGRMSQVSQESLEK